MTLIYKQGRIEIWHVDGEYLVYGVTRDPMRAPSIGMARAIAGKA